MLGWMSYEGEGVLERIHAKFTSAACLEILDNVLVPSARRRYTEGTLVNQQGNHPVHHALAVQKWFRRRRDIDLLEQPPKSLFLNPIEHVWVKMKRQVPPRNPGELWNRVLHAWHDVALDVLL